MSEQEQLIADQAELEAFARKQPADRQLTERLRGVLAETAVSGVIRYPWPLLKPLIVQLLQEQLTKYEAENHVEVGPARPILDSSDGSDGSVQQLCDRFVKLLAAFHSHPWTLQRLCEVLLEPQKQYKRLHKLALAVEKLLLVTGELAVSEQPGPPPALSQLTRVNEAPPPAAAAAGGAAGAGAGQQGNAHHSRQGDSDGAGLINAALDIRQVPQQQQQQSDAAAASAGAAAEQPAEAAAAASGAAEASTEPMQVDAAGPQPSADAGGVAAGGAGVVYAPTAMEADGGGQQSATAAAAAAPAAGEAAGPEAAAATLLPSAEVAAAAADVEMTTEEVPAVTDLSHTNAVAASSPAGSPAAAVGGITEGV